jgi:hypothetical protein
MNEMPDCENESEVKLRWYIERFPSPHHFFRPAMAALEKKEKEAKLQSTSRPTIHIENSSVANLNLGSQVGEIAAHAIRHTSVDFDDYLRQMVRVADLEWSLLNKPNNMVLPQTVCKQVDDLRAGLVILYGKCPGAADGQLLRAAIEKLDETRNYRMGKQIGSQVELDQVCGLMKAALAIVNGMVQRG